MPTPAPVPTTLEAEFATMLNTLSQQGHSPASTDPAPSAPSVPVVTATAIQSSPEAMHSSPAAAAKEEAVPGCCLTTELDTKPAEHPATKSDTQAVLAAPAPVSNPPSAKQPCSQQGHAQDNEHACVVDPDQWRAQLPEDMHPQWLQLLGAKQCALEEVCCDVVLHTESSSSHASRSTLADSEDAGGGHQGTGSHEADAAAVHRQVCQRERLCTVPMPLHIHAPHRLAHDAEQHVAAQYAAFVETARVVSAKRQQLQQCKALWRTFANAACGDGSALWPLPA